MRQIILDTETTGLNPSDGHRVIEIGAIELIDRKITGKTFHHYLNPDREVEEEALSVHGITNEFLKDKPRFNEIIESFIEFVASADLIIHNAPFDIGFLNHEIRLLNNSIRADMGHHCEDIIDTLVLARKLHPGQRNNLDALCKRYSVSNKHREWHGALLDAELLAHVYLAMTGGQVALFGEEQPHKTSQKKTKSQQKTYVRKPEIIIPICQATEDELNEHELFMNELAQN